MSLEQALTENTKALLALTAALAAGGLVSAPVAEAAVTKSTKTKKVTQQEQAEADAAAGKFGAPNEGDPAGTMYFLNQKHNSVYRQFPGDPHVTIAESKQISGADFLAHQAAQAAAAQSTKSASSATTSAVDPAQAAGADLFASEPVKVDRATMVAKLMEAAQAKGQPALVPILKKAGAVNVPGIAEDKIQEVYEGACALLK
jgi:hypothetical protein